MGEIIMRHGIAAIILMAVAVSTAAAFDTLKTLQGNVPGRFLSMNPTRVEFQESRGGALTKEVPVNQVLTIFFDGEPPDLKVAKNHVLGGHYAEALAALERIKQQPSRAEVQQDIDFYKALCTTKLALGGSMKIADAGRMMKAFADANPNSYHYYAAVAAVGDLLVAAEQYGPAAEYYTRLQNAPWPDYQMRAGTAAGQALLAQGKADEAMAAFERVISTAAEGEQAQRQRMLARVGKAAALVALDKPDEAIKLVDEVLEQTDPETKEADVPLAARAYNVLGAAQRKAGRVREAIMAYLRVELLYSSQPAAHAEALANLAELWEQVHKSDRAARARQNLKEQYPDSPWAKKGGE